MASRHAAHEFPMTIKAVVFDAYGTLYDIQSVAAVTEEAVPGYGEIINANLADQAARIHLAAFADAALPGFLRDHAGIARLYAAMPWAGKLDTDTFESNHGQVSTSRP